MLLYWNGYHWSLSVFGVSLLSVFSSIIFSTGSNGNSILQFCLYVPCSYRIASNYGRSHINAWSGLVAGENSIITKINDGSLINAGFFLRSQ